MICLVDLNIRVVCIFIIHILNSAYPGKNQSGGPHPIMQDS